jgi:DNA-binding GntR family transcriptional regulator
MGSLAAALGPAPAPQLMREQALETVKDAIISGRLPPGQRLIERELCAALGVSRTIVREVIRSLEAERLVQISSHRRPQVTVLTVKAAREIYDLRADLESMLVRDFVRNASDAQIAELAGLLPAIRDAARVNDVEALLVIMRQFYVVLIAGADNEVVADILESLHARISRLRVLAMSESGRTLKSVEEIGRIVCAIERRDSATAVEETQQYVLAARDAAMRQIALQSKEACDPSA